MTSSLTAVTVTVPVVAPGKINMVVELNVKSLVSVAVPEVASNTFMVSEAALEAVAVSVAVKKLSLSPINVLSLVNATVGAESLSVNVNETLDEDPVLPFVTEPIESVNVSLPS